MDAIVELKNQKEYYQLLESFQTWVVKVENILKSTQPNSDEEIQFYIQQLEVLFI